MPNSHSRPDALSPDPIVSGLSRSGVFPAQRLPYPPPQLGPLHCGLHVQAATAAASKAAVPKTGVPTRGPFAPTRSRILFPCLAPSHSSLLDLLHCAAAAAATAAPFFSSFHRRRNHRLLLSQSVCRVAHVPRSRSGGGLARAVASAAAEAILHHFHVRRRRRFSPLRLVLRSQFWPPHRCLQQPQAQPPPLHTQPQTEQLSQVPQRVGGEGIFDGATLQHRRHLWIVVRAQLEGDAATS